MGMVRTTAAAVLAAGCFAVWAAPADAARVSFDGTASEYDAALGEVNDLTLSIAASTVTFHDAGAAVHAGAGCTQVDPATADCPAGSGVGVYLFDGADHLLVTGSLPGFFVFAGRGDDVLQGGPGRDFLFGGFGSDTVIGNVVNVSLVADAPFETDSPGSLNRLVG